MEKPNSPLHRRRRERAIERLDQQLQSGKKHNKGVFTDLTEEDQKRIKKEIEILQKRLKY